MMTTNLFSNGSKEVRRILSYNCLDRHLDGPNRDKPAIIWEGEPGESKILTYAEMHSLVCRFANVLKSLGVKKGDRVAIYLPMVVELPAAVLACARIGAVHNVVFAGFSSESIKDRVLDSEAKLVITADAGWRRVRCSHLKISWMLLWRTATVWRTSSL